MTTVIRITPTRAIFNGGQFDTDNRYLRTVSSGVMTTMLAGPSIAVIFNQTWDRIAYRYQCGGYVLTVENPEQSAPGSVSNTPTAIAL